MPHFQPPLKPREEETLYRQIRIIQWLEPDRGTGNLTGTSLTHTVLILMTSKMENVGQNLYLQTNWLATATSRHHFLFIAQLSRNWLLGQRDIEVSEGYIYTAYKNRSDEGMTDRMRPDHWIRTCLVAFLPPCCLWRQRCLAFRHSQGLLYLELPLIPSFTIPYITLLIKSTEWVSKWANSYTECIGSAADDIFWLDMGIYLLYHSKCTGFPNLTGSHWVYISCTPVY